MPETKLVVEHREQLWSLLIEAAEFEHMIMCQYLYACYSLKTEPDEGLTADQADAVARWQKTLTGIAIEEMLHLALVMNIMTAIGAAPPLSRPNFPRDAPPAGIPDRRAPVPGDRAGPGPSRQPARRTGAVRGRAAGAGHAGQVSLAAAHRGDGPGVGPRGSRRDHRAG